MLPQDQSAEFTLAFNSDSLNTNPPAPQDDLLTEPAARINQGSLELIQWVAFACMVIDHIGALGLFAGRGDAHNLFAMTNTHPTGALWVMRFIGRMALPLFSLVFAWRLANMRWRFPGKDYLPMGFRLLVCALVSEIVWSATGEQMPANVIFMFGAALVVVLLIDEGGQNDASILRILRLPLGIRWVACVVISFFVNRYVDYGATGLTLTLSAFAWARWGKSFDGVGMAIGITALALLTVGFPVHGAIVALPLAWLLLNSGWTMKRRVNGIFYWLYPLHIVALTFLGVFVA